MVNFKWTKLLTLQSGFCCFGKNHESYLQVFGELLPLLAPSQPGVELDHGAVNVREGPSQQEVGSHLYFRPCNLDGK